MGGRGSKTEYVYVQPTIEQRIGNQKAKMAAQQDSMDRQMKLFNESLGELDVCNRSVLSSLEQQIHQTSSSAQAEMQSVEERTARESSEIAEQIELLKRQLAEVNQTLFEHTHTKEQVERKLRVGQERIAALKKSLDEERDTLLKQHEALVGNVEEDKKHTVNALESYFGASALSDTSVGKLAELLSYLNALPFETNKMTLQPVQEYIFALCESMRTTVSQFSDALKENSNMELAPSIEWARRNTPSKVADWMEAEEMDIGALIDSSPQELKDAIPFQLNSILFNRLIARLQQVKTNEQDTIKRAQEGMRQVSLEVSPALTWQEPLRGIVAGQSAKRALLNEA